jgi:hypothetical protein
MRSETKRRWFFVFGFVACGGAAILACASPGFAQRSDVGRMTSVSPRPGQWLATDPLAANERQPDASEPTVRAAPVAATISVGSMQVPSGALKEFRRSEKCVRSGDYTGAVQHLQKALKIDPKFVEAHNNLGAGFLEMERYRDAIAEFDATIAIDSKLEAPYRNKSLRLRRGKRSAWIQDERQRGTCWGAPWRRKAADRRKRSTCCENPSANFRRRGWRWRSCS